MNIILKFIREFTLIMFKNIQIQEKLHSEITEVLSKHNGKLDHETIQEMEYLEAVFAENLRIMPPVILHARVCTKDCQVTLSGKLT